ncbi:PLD nuclease N-terminal domain-containing protein [Sinomonas albida]|uniref:PLD nuclease N-terminal domain-containing protein n=1 Tax=Sinomonas albida TaxID=369942 RepID=UPI0030196B49
MARRTKQQWKDMSAGGRAGVIIMGAFDLALKILAWRDLARRPASQVRGSKFGWFLGTFVNTLGPIGYFLFGRKRPEISPTHY